MPVECRPPLTFLGLRAGRETAMQATAATVVNVYPLAGCPLSRSRTAVFSLGQYTKFFQGSHAVLVVQILHLIILSVALVAGFGFRPIMLRIRAASLADTPRSLAFRVIWNPVEGAILGGPPRA